jgi:hypothetical protein
LKLLKEYCEYDTLDLFESLGKLWNDSERDTNRYLYLDRGEDSRVLFVAHLDTVNDFWTPIKGKQAPKWTKPNYAIKNNKKYGDYVQSIALDDRLGVYAGLYMLPALGINCDVLLTLDEEIGASTAKEFKTSKQYNWIFSFDRHDLNPVLYQYDTDEMRDRLESVGYKISHGTFSDICYLDHLGVSGINFGIGYQNEHSQKCTAYLSDFDYCIDMFVKFYEKYKDEHMPYTPVPKYTAHNGYYSHVWDELEDWPNDGFCKVCGVQLLDTSVGICIMCEDYMDSLDAEHDREFGQDESEDRKLYRAYCDVCSCDLELPKDQLNKDVILCSKCEKSYANNLGGL